MLISEPVISVSFAQSIMILMDACIAFPDGEEGETERFKKRPAFEARIKQMQRLNVLRREEAATGRQAFGLTELSILATAMKLMAAYMPPSLAARYVTEQWRALAPFALAGASEALPADYLQRRGSGGGSIAVFTGNALAELGREGRQTDPYSGLLGAVTIVESPADIDLTTVGGSGLVIESRAYMPAIMRCLSEITFATQAEIAAEADRLRFCL